MAQATALVMKWNEPSIQKGQQPYCLHDSITKISRIELTDVNYLSNKVENTCSDIQERIAGLIKHQNGRIIDGGTGDESLRFLS